MLYIGLTFPNTCWKMKTCQLLWTIIVVPVQKTHDQEWQGVPRIGEHQLRCLCYKTIWLKCGWIIKWIQNWLYKIDQIKRRPTPKSFSASECLCIACTDTNRLNLMCHQVKNISSSCFASAFTNANSKSKKTKSAPKKIDSPWQELLQVQAEVQAPPPCDNPLNVIIWFNDPKYGPIIQNMVQ